MKKQILKTIYSCFSEWSGQYDFQCEAGCSTCCSQNITITALEGEVIVKYCRERKTENWLRQRLAQAAELPRMHQTTNQFAQALLNNEDSIDPPPVLEYSCVFLENGSCSIYPSRPFSCRCFASEVKCGSSHAAAVPPHYLYASVAVMQIIEHLGQFEGWGYMTNMVKNHLCSTASADDAWQYRALANTNNNILTAQPLPGFIYPLQQEKQIAPLLESIFSSQVGGKTIEQILNGKL